MNTLVVLGVFLAALFTLVSEHMLKFPKELLLIVGGFILGAIWLIAAGGERQWDASWISLLCVLLFVQNYRARLCDITQYRRIIGVFSILSAGIFTLLSGGLLLLCTGEEWLTCFAAGASLSVIVPAPALYLLRRGGIPEEAAGVIEGLSLFGSGTAMVFAAFLSGWRDGGILGAARSLGGGLLLGAVLTVLFVLLFRTAREEQTGTLVAVCAVVSTVALCNAVSVSAPVAVFLLGLGFAMRVDRREQRYPQDYIFYRHTWQLVDDVLCSAGLVLAGAFAVMAATAWTPWSILAVVLMPLVRLVSLAVSTPFCGVLPQKYKKLPFVSVVTVSSTGGCIQLLMLAVIGAGPTLCWVVSLSVVLGIVGSSLTAGRILDHVEQRRRFDAPKPLYHD